MSPIQDRRKFLRNTLGALGAWGLAGCGGGNGAASAPIPAAPAAAAPAKIDQPIVKGAKAMFQVPAGTLAGIIARPETFVGTYNALGGSTSAQEYVRAQLGSSFASMSDAGAMATFASVVAFNAAPLGTTALAPLTATMQQLLTSTALTCGHYCKLATLLTLLGHPELIPPDADTSASAKPSLHFLVWLGTVPLNTGYHSQLIITNVLDGAYLLLDPTYAYALRIPFVGGGPQASLSVIENAATMLQTPITQDNLAVLDAAGTANTPQMLSTLTSGALGPQYIFHDGAFGSEAWDDRIAQVFDSMG
jgi:hypothetical protein